MYTLLYLFIFHVNINIFLKCVLGIDIFGGWLTASLTCGVKCIMMCGRPDNSGTVPVGYVSYVMEGKLGSLVE